MFMVAGVTGNTGKVVAETLLAAGKQVRVLARDAKQGDPWRARGADVAVGTLDDEAALTQALAGAEGAYLLLPPAVTAPDVLAVQAERIETIARAIAAAKAPHVVFLSSVGAHLPGGTGPIRSLHAAEQRFARLEGTRFTHVRAAYFMENDLAALGTLEQGIVPSFVPKDRAFDRVATRDIGKAAAEALLEGKTAPRVIELAGPRALSASDVAATLGELTHKALNVAEGPAAAIVPTFESFGMSHSMAKLYEEMLLAIGADGIPFEGSGARFVRGDTELREVFAAALGR
jgi:uncharacterized protein YbjT (DUF2867 family)